MAQHTLPLLFINLGGEMLYILDQRLKAQKIPTDKAKKVLNEIAGIMLNQRFLDELFKPQEVFNKGALRNLFHDLAHASIMRLNDASMGKLYDLMIMAVKQQVFYATEPKDLILITLNHLDSVRYLVSAPCIHKQLDSAYFLIIKTYGQMSSGELQRLRYTIMNFFQDIKVRVSIFLRQHIQNNDGTFKIPASLVIPHGNEIPGSIRVFGTDGCIEDLLSFNPGGNYTVAAEPGSTELRGTRRTSLGMNMYDTSRGESSWDQPGLDSNAKWDCPEYNNASYREELNLLLTQLLGNKHVTNTGSGVGSCEVIKLNLFEMQDVDEENRLQTQEENCVANSPMSDEHANTLHKIKKEMMIEDDNIDKQLTMLDLLDLA